LKLPGLKRISSNNDLAHPVEKEAVMAYSYH
jgi:hypothetical protein